MPPRIRLQICGGSTSRQISPPPFHRRAQKATDNAILDAEAQLIAQVRASDEDGGHGGAPDDVQLDPRLVLQSLDQESKEQSVQNRQKRRVLNFKKAKDGFRSSKRRLR